MWGEHGVGTSYDCCIFHYPSVQMHGSLWVCLHHLALRVPTWGLDRCCWEAIAWVLPPSPSFPHTVSMGWMGWVRNSAHWSRENLSLWPFPWSSRMAPPLAVGT